MSRTQFTGTGKLFWVPDPTGAGTVVTLNAPTATQVNTGTNIVKFLRRDGLDTPQTGNVMDTSDAASRKNSSDLGTFGGDKAGLDLYRDSVSGTDTAYPLFAQGLRGFLIVLRFGTAGASPAAGDRCEVYQCAIVARTPVKTAENVPNMFHVDIAIQDSNDNATLV